jgi:hypothetical protein
MIVLEDGLTFEQLTIEDCTKCHNCQVQSGNSSNVEWG